MSTQPYDLSDNVNEHFDFIVGGHTYRMKYPLVEELEQLQTIVKTTEGKEGSTDVQDWLYEYIKPVSDAAPPIAETMKKQNVKVMAKFKDMFQSEFGLE